ncbi:MAG: band 7 protein [Elusimicrobia bacterium]|nr:MAG: band 7 protein [Elusimicrobiota bacterium]
MTIFVGCIAGFIAWFLVNYLVAGFYTVNQNERAVKTSFGRAMRIEGKSTLDDPMAESLREDERQRYAYPAVEVIQPGGPYFKWPWQKIHKVVVATQTMNMAQDLENHSANKNGTELEAVTKDQLNVGLTGDIRFRISDRNMYAYLFAVKNPIVHVMGYFVAILRERIANFEVPQAKGGDETGAEAAGISINDLRKNLRAINDHMESECASAEARYGIVFEASLITGIDPPPEVDSALAAINTAHNEVSSEISLARAAADQRIVESKRAVEIETLKAQAEVEPLNSMAAQLLEFKQTGGDTLMLYLRNLRLALYSKAQVVVVEPKS